MKFTDLFIRRPVLATVVSLLILLIGLWSVTALPVRQYPKLENTLIQVTTTYPGESADLMQGFITVPIEQAVASAEGIDYLTSSTTLGRSVVSAYIQLNQVSNQAMTDVMAKVNQVKYRLPKDANDPIITKSTGGSTPVMYIGFFSPQLRKRSHRRHGCWRSASSSTTQSSWWKTPTATSRRDVAPSKQRLSVPARSLARLSP
jgi:multidrug efflux pump